MSTTTAPKATRKRRTKQPADAADIRRRLVKTASELSKLRPPCDFCSPGIELSVHLDGAFVLADVHHEPGCGFSDHLREQLITSDEIAAAIDDEHQGDNPAAEQ